MRVTWMYMRSEPRAIQLRNKDDLRPAWFPLIIQIGDREVPAVEISALFRPFGIDIAVRSRRTMLAPFPLRLFDLIDTEDHTAQRAPIAAPTKYHLRACHLMTFCLATNCCTLAPYYARTVSVDWPDPFPGLRARRSLV